MIFIVLGTISASAQQYLLSGRITDQNNNVVPFSSVYIKNSTYGTTSNEDGAYQFKLSPGTYSVIYRVVGYNEKIVSVTITNHDEQLNVQMQDEVFATGRVSGNSLRVSAFL